MANLTLKFPQSTKDVFEAVKTGLKNVETRAATPKYRAIKPGDKLTLACGADILEVIVIRACRFASVEDLYREIPVESVLPGVKTVKDAKAIHYGFDGYREKLQKFGIMAFDIKLEH